MTFQEAEKTYKDLKTQHAAGKLSDADFEAQVGKLKLQDAQGKWWQIGVQTGEWYVHDGQKWSKAKPPAEVPPAPPPPIEPSATPEGAASTPQPANSKSQRASVAPTRLFSAKPAGREGGLPTSVLIIIVAVVALIGIAILVGGYFFITGGFGGTTARTTTTPTRSVAQATLSAAAPTITLARPTEAPTAVPSPTLVLTTTAPTTVTVPAPTIAPTRRPVTPATKPTVAPTRAASATPAPPAGLYVVKMVTDPALPNFNEATGFKITLFNNGSKFDQMSMRVKIYSCTDQGSCAIDDLRKSLGETKATNINPVSGTFEVVAPRTWQVGVGACKFVAVPFYTDKDTGQLEPFKTTAGKALYYEFSLCR